MLQKSRGIVFRSTDYGETSLIVKIYTELFGVQSYIINSVRKRHARLHANIFQPMTPVHLVVYQKGRPGIHRIADVRPHPPLLNIPFDVQKSSMIFFLDEVLFKSIHEEESNPAMFDFIYDSICRLDKPGPAGNEFHLLFLLKLSRFLGFAPSRNFSKERNIFNLKEGVFQNSIPDHPHFISGTLAVYFSEMLDAEYDSVRDISSTNRRLLIEAIVEYYQLHVDGFGNIRSHKVLEQVWE